jgi:hypothetical protein
MIHRRIGYPSLTSILQVGHHTTPSVFDPQTMKTSKNKSHNDKDSNADFGHLDKFCAQIIDDGQVELVTKGHGVLAWNRENRRVERDIRKCIIDICLDKFKWLIEAVIPIKYHSIRNRMRPTCCQ